MASSKSYLTFILDQLSDVDGVTWRSMMGEYILYYRDRIAFYICDDRLLAKPVPSAVAYVPHAIYEHPYEGAKEMLLIENVDDRSFLTGLLQTMADELPPKKKSKAR